MNFDLYSILFAELNDAYGVDETENYLYKYLNIRTAIINDKRKVSDKEIIKQALEDLNITIYSNNAGSEEIKISYYDGENLKEEKVSLFMLGKEFMDNLRFRADLEGNTDFKEDLEAIFRKGYQSAYKDKSHASYLIKRKLFRLEELEKEYGTNVTPVNNKINPFCYSEEEEYSLPFKRTVEETLDLEIEALEFAETSLNLTEKELEDYLVENLNLIEEGMTFVSRQVNVPRGIIDILARDSSGVICIIEVKIAYDKSIVWQSLYYPKAIKEMYNTSKVRMITLTPEFNNSAIDPVEEVLKSIDDVEIMKYSLTTKKKEVISFKVNKK